MTERCLDKFYLKIKKIKNIFVGKGDPRNPQTYIPKNNNDSTV